MNHTAFLFISAFLAASLPMTPEARADFYEGCMKKQQAVERQLAIARQHNNTHKVEGLERALANIKSWCSENNMRAKADYEVWEKQREVEERRQELEEAKAGGKAKKIAKREEKLREAEKELREAEEERKALP